ncbi:MAG: alpha-E domain-containing protein, partial [Pseudomonadota bacterium]|nr:alpha-E domain-containing protein [Pseudomonadota bacterium]
MLSRVAERLYWMARYLERAENSARMIMAFN